MRPILWVFCFGLIALAYFQLRNLRTSSDSVVLLLICLGALVCGVGDAILARLGRPVRKRA